MKHIKALAFFAFSVFVLFLILSMLVMFMDCDFKPFWHEYHWFENLG